MTILKTHRKKRMKRSLSLVLALAMTVTGLPGGLHSTGRTKAAEEIGKLAELTFDDANDPLLAGNAKAEAPNGYSLIERNGGKALSLSDSQNQYIALTAADGSSLLKGKNEITISYDAKINKSGTNWVFFASRGEASPVYNTENYLGAIQSPTNINIERYCEGRNSSKSSRVATDVDDTWQHYDVVVQNDATRIFVDGKLKATAASTSSLTDMLADNGIFYIGKATWGSGEYSKFDIDNFTVYDGVQENINIDDYLVGSYSFEGDAKNTVTQEDDTSIYKQGFKAYSGTPVFEKGINGQAVRFDGNYGYKLNKTNLGTDFTLSAWVKPDGAMPENQVMMFLGYHDPEKWIGVSGKNGSNKVKIWGKGDNLTTWTTLFEPEITSDSWHNLVLTGTKGVLTAYLDGVKIGESNRSNNPLTQENGDIYLALNNWDAQFKGLMDEVRVYNMCIDSDNVKDEYNKIMLQYTVDNYVLPYGGVRDNITLPSSIDNDIEVSWESDRKDVLTDDGFVTRGSEDISVTLKATFVKGSASTEKSYVVTVLAADDQADVNDAINSIKIPKYIDKSITLPQKAVYGVDISWESSEPDVLNGEGLIGQKRPQTGQGDATVTLTATFKKGEVQQEKEYIVSVMEKEYGYILGYVAGDNDRTGSLHLAYSRDGKTFTALNGNSGVLFAKNDTSDGNKNLSTGIRFKGTSLVRVAKGSFAMLAPQGKNDKYMYVYSSNNLLEYSEADDSFKSDMYDQYGDNVYADAQADFSGLTVPKGAKNGSIIGLTKDEYDAIVERFGIVGNESVEIETDAITIDTEADLADALPKTATATYSDGSEAVFDISWDQAAVDMSMPGTYTLNGKVNTYLNPLIEQRADPQIKYDADENCYYFTASYPAFNNVNNGYDRIILRKADSISGLADENGGLEKEITIWRAASSGKMSKHVWAPELHKIEGKWYVFFAAGDSDNIWNIRPYVLVCQDSSNPYNEDSWKLDDGSYEIHAATSRQDAYFKHMSLDMTYFEQDGKHYVIWADIIGQSALYMQEIDPLQPWMGTSDKVIMLTTPEYGWERDTERVNEGPTILKHDGKIFCAFSASGTGPEYCIGMLYADENADLLDENSWTKMGYPLLTSADVPEEYGPGHNSFTVDAGGNPVFVYHARSKECYENKCEWASSNSLYDPCRHARVKNVHWTKDGLPILKMSSEEELPSSMRDVSISVTVKNRSGKNLESSLISGIDTEYEYAGEDVEPEPIVEYKGTVLTKDVDYTVSYENNGAIGKATVKITAVEGTEYYGENSQSFDIISAPVKVADYVMELNDGVVKNIISDQYDLVPYGIPETSFKDGVVNLNKNGYLSIPKGVIDDNTFTMSIVTATNLVNDQWLVSLGKDSWNYAFFTPTNKFGKSRFSIAKHDPISGITGAYSYEENAEADSNATDGRFHVYTVVVNNNVTALYEDGVKIATGTNSQNIPGLADGAGVLGYIGKSLYSGDPLYVGSVGKFTVYDGALTDRQVMNEAAGYDLNEYFAGNLAMTMLGDNKDASNITTDINLPSSLNAVDVSWSIEANDYITSDGKVTRPVGGPDADVNVVASWGEDNKYTKTFNLTIKAITVNEIMSEISLPYGDKEENNITGNITLPEKTASGIAIEWSCNKSDVISTTPVINEGYDPTPAGIVKRGKTDTELVLTAKINVNGETYTKDFEAIVKAAPALVDEDDYTDYFFAYFTGEGSANGEQIYFASSEDGMNWKELNDGKPSLVSTLGEKGVRDPFIIRSAEGDKFYLIATDLKIYGGNGWGNAQTAGSQALMIWESDDLVNWSKQRMVEISASIDAGCTWAPEATYDPVTGEYVVYWASKVAGDNYSKQRLYYSKTRDFYSFTEPKVFIDYNESSIDTTIIMHNGTYYRYTKNEGGNTNSLGALTKTIFVEKSDRLLGEYTQIPSDSLNSNQWVEGPTIFKLNNDDSAGDTWCLLVDNYGSGGYYPLISNDLESGVFTKPASGTYKMPNGARHGTPIRITKAEYNKVMGVVEPTVAPTKEPTIAPTKKPTIAPTKEPTVAPTKEPTIAPTKKPTIAPTKEPTVAPTKEPTVAPTKEPTIAPTKQPTVAPTKEPTVAPTQEPTVAPTIEPTVAPTKIPEQTQAPAKSETEATISPVPVFAKQKAITSNSVTIRWNRLDDADGYDLYMAQGKGKLKLVKSLLASKSSIKIKKLKKGTYYKFRVDAYKLSGDEKIITGKSALIYIATKGGKYVNATKVKLTKSRLKMTVGKKANIKAKAVKNKGIMKNFTKSIRYISSDTSICTVNSKGRVKGIKAGTAKIYCYTQNGIYKTVKVQVR